MDWHHGLAPWICSIDLCSRHWFASFIRDIDWIGSMDWLHGFVPLIRAIDSWHWFATLIHWFATLNVNVNFNFNFNRHYLPGHLCPPCLMRWKRSTVKFIYMSRPISFSFCCTPYYNPKLRAHPGQITRALHNIRKGNHEHFVPLNLGYVHIMLIKIFYKS